ncbi:MAG: NUDIX hydrolase [Anaerolineales bacterium]|nr:NUDIX hydrolase [Chloroflexota bacterium]MBL6981741.1 NUDIX hydrolase [Anaerolineales bacterium]
MNEREVKYCPLCGKKLISANRAGRDRPVCPSCDWIYFPDPKVAAAVLVEQGKNVLLVRRIMQPYQGFWTLPAGFVDAGEDPARAAERECLEETGLQVRVTEIFDIISGQEHAAGAHIVIVYRAKVLGGELAAGDDADEVGYFNRDNLPPLGFEATKQVLGNLH